jgi:hypothetical protein
MVFNVCFKKLSTLLFKRQKNNIDDFLKNPDVKLRENTKTSNNKKRFICNCMTPFENCCDHPDSDEKEIARRIRQASIPFKNEIMIKN